MMMRSSAVVAVGLLAGLTLAPRCSTRSSDGSAATPGALVENPSPATRVPAAAVSPIAAVSQEPAEPPPAAAPDEFRATIRPILSARCGRCHDPGGKMYARLPFDDPGVVSSHSDGVLRRLKGDDRAAMEKWLAGL
jgi:hypothetical protein